MHLLCIGTGGNMLKELLEQITGELTEKGFVLGNNPFSAELIVQHKVDTTEQIRRARTKASESARSAANLPDPLPEPTIQYVIFPTSTRLENGLRDHKGLGPFFEITTVRITLLVPMYTSNKIDSLYKLFDIEEDVKRTINKTRSVNNGTVNTPANGYFENISRQEINEYIRSDITFTIKHQMLRGT